MTTLLQLDVNTWHKTLLRFFSFFSSQNDAVAVKQSELKQQQALIAEEERRRMNLLNALSRDYTTTSDDSESFCKYNVVMLEKAVC